MIAIVYSGSNNADWKLADKNKIIANFKTNGINPFFNDEKYILNLLNKNINLIHHAEQIKRIYFFGAGAASVESKTIVSQAFGKFFKNGKISVEHDIAAAAIASCEDEPGIVCIIDSGSNAAYFDGKKIKPNNYGLGFALADEGSAAWLGLSLLKNYLNETMPQKIKEQFIAKFDLERKQILDKIYRNPQPMSFITTFMDFIIENRDDQYIIGLIKSGFRKFIDLYLVRLIHENPGTPVYIVGATAASFQDYLRETALEAGIEIRTVIKEPIYNLLNYYSNKN
jgi:glucosamine kinase